MSFLFALLAVSLAGCGRTSLAGRDEPVPDYPSFLADARSGYEATLAEAEQAAAAEPKNGSSRFYLGAALANLKRHEEALSAFTLAAGQLKRDMDFARDRCGEMRMYLGRFEEAIADFEGLGNRNRSYVPRTWLRGVALYFVGRYADADAQFAAYGEQPMLSEDLLVRTAVWRCLCQRRLRGAEEVGGPLLGPIREGDTALMRFAGLLAGSAGEKDVLKAAGRRPESHPHGLGDRFDAHFFLALYHDAEGNEELADRHLTTAVVRYQVGHSDWDVARAWLLRRRAARG